MKNNNIELIRKAVSDSKPIIDFSNAALLIIDMQEYQTREGSITKIYGMISPSISEYYLERVKNIAEPNVIRVLNQFRKIAAPVIFTKFASVKEDESDLAQYCRDGNQISNDISGEPLIPHINSKAASLTAAFEPKKDEILLQKARSGAFINTSLDDLLREKGVEQLVIAGVLTHACVENTARVGIDLGYSVFVVDDACATLDPDLHENSIAAMEVLSASIVQAEDVIDAATSNS